MHSADNPHPSYLRLLQGLRRVVTPPPEGTTDVGAAFGGSPQMANNWPTRGVPSKRAAEAESKWGIRSAWILSADGPETVSELSQTARPDLDTIHRALDFLEDLFSARGKAFDRKRYPLLLAAVVDDMLLPSPPTIVKLSMKYGECADAGKDWSGNSATGTG